MQDVPEILQWNQWSVEACRGEMVISLGHCDFTPMTWPRRDDERYAAILSYQHYGVSVSPMRERLRSCYGIMREVDDGAALRLVAASGSRSIELLTCGARGDNPKRKNFGEGAA